MSRFVMSLQPSDVYNITATVAQTDTGALGQTADSRKYRYVRAGASPLVAGTLQQSVVEDTTNWEALAVTATAAGAFAVTTSTTVTLAKDLLAGGYMVVTTAPGIGYTYKIKGNTVAAGAVTTIYLEDPIQVALTTASRIDCIPDPYGAVVQNATGHTGAIVGVACTALPALYYGWLQVGGPCGVLNDATGALTVGDLIVASQGTAGCVRLAVNATTEAFAPVGVAITGIAASENGLVNLMIN
jgi:hypothetical protein